ncbi:MAG: hypothetical protein ACOX1Q_07040 [Eubacteriales bacterium]
MSGKTRVVSLLLGIILIFAVVSGCDNMNARSFTYTNDHQSNGRANGRAYCR